MGNQVCCDQFEEKEAQKNVTITKLHRVSVPILSEVVTSVVSRQKPFEKLFPQFPSLKCYGNDVYEGNTDEIGRPDGYGKMYHKNGSIFLGKFQHGIANGPGFFVLKDGSFYRGSLAGNKTSDDCGYFKSGNFEYEGGFANNKFDGKGKEKGQLYEFQGTYVDGKKEKGVFKWKEDNCEMVYTGKFADNGLFHGEGELKQEKGVYKGEFANGKKHGKGKFVFETGFKYEGDYKNNMKWGIGKILNKDDSIAYEGEFMNDLPHGNGKMRTKEGMKDIKLFQGVQSMYLEEQQPF